MDEQTSSAETAPKQKSSKRGCLIAAVVVVAIIILIVAVGGYLIYRFSQTEKGQAIIGFSLAIAEGAKAPGTAELREMGCDQAFVVEKDKLIELGIIPGLDMLEGEQTSGKLVVCQAASMDPVPTCDAVARIYRQSFGGSAPHPFAAVVVKELGKDVECMQYYSGEGMPGQ